MDGDQAPLLIATVEVATPSGNRQAQVIDLSSTP
jgi:hypothetical protein